MIFSTIQYNILLIKEADDLYKFKKKERWKTVNNNFFDKNNLTGGKMAKVKRALISVSDKTGIVDFAR